jgi:hypothetical protein
MINMINEYRDKLQQRLTNSFVNERNLLNEHSKAIIDRKKEALGIKDSLLDVVDSELKIISKNEQEYHRL